MFPILTDFFMGLFQLTCEFLSFMDFWSFLINEDCAKRMYGTRDVVQG